MPLPTGLNRQQSRLAPIPPLHPARAASRRSAPVVDPGFPSVTTIHRISRRSSDANLTLDLPELPAFTDHEFLPVFNAKMRLCEHLFQFFDDGTEKAGIEYKTKTLEEFHSLVRRPNFPASIVPRLFEMIEANIVRFISYEERLLLHADCPRIVDPSWPHLSLVYSILTQIAVLFPCHECFSLNFFRKLLIPSGSPDANEQRAIRDFFVALFRGAAQLRGPVVEAYEGALMDHRDAHRRSPFLVMTALSVLFYIVEQTLPLLPISRRVFMRSVLPLLADEQMPFYALAIERHLGFFLEDRPSHGTRVVRALLAAFPLRGVRKQRAILDLVGTALDRPIKFSTDLAIPVARVLVRAGESQNETVAQAGLKMWSRASIDRLMLDQRRLIVPLAVPSISMVMDTHWSCEVRQTAKSCFAAFQRRDGRMVQESLLESAFEGPLMEQTPQIRNWVSIAKAAEICDQTIDIGGMMQQILLLFGPTIRSPMDFPKRLTMPVNWISSGQQIPVVIPRLT
jgi:hypothetical protein